MELYESLSQYMFIRFNWDPEDVSVQVLQTLEWLAAHQQQIPWILSALESQLGLTDPKLTQTLWGLTFPNPVGLAAGFDKNGVAVGIWPRLGFGFAELGTVTAQAQPGNPRPRLFRLAEDQAALNRMGFNNLGSVALAERLTEAKRQQALRIPVGINLGKSRTTPLEDAAADYLASFQALKGLGDYFVVNVSSPNTPGLRSLQAADQLKTIVDQLQAHNDQSKPILVKIAPDLDDQEILALIESIEGSTLAGIIATNTTLSRAHLKTQRLSTGHLITEEAGGISGKPLQQRSTEVIRLIYHHTQGRIPIIGVGGIFSAEDAWQKITAGASLVQVYTGWIYKGPGMVKRILQGLQHKLGSCGLGSLSEAVGRSELDPIPPVGQIKGDK